MHRRSASPKRCVARAPLGWLRCKACRQASWATRSAAATGGHTGCAVAGDLLMGMARNCGAAGFVTDGCVRDIPGIRAAGLPCFALGVTPNSPAREGPGTVGLPVVLAGVAIATVDILVGDQDGVVVVPFERIDEVVARLDKVRAAEAELDAKVKAGLRLPPFLER